MVHHQRLSKIVLMAVLSLALSACNYEYNKLRGNLEETGASPNEGSSSEENTIPDEDRISFQQVRDSVFTPRCQQCHSGRGVFTFEDYSTVKSMVAKIENRVFSIGDMPPRPLTEEQKEFLHDWISQGAPL